jgi:hypothetical protein
MTEHPSYLQLDQLWLGARDAAVAGHAQQCAQCRAHLGRLEQPVAIPRWVRELPGQRTAWRRPFFMLAGAIACAAAIAIAVWPRTVEEELTPKGSPSFAIYFKRDGDVKLWDGAMPLRAGDSLQLKLRGEGFTRVSIASMEKDGPREIYQGEVSEEPTLLPQAFGLDAAPTTLLIVFAHSKIEAKSLKSIAENPLRTKGVWATELVLTKGDHQ